MSKASIDQASESNGTIKQYAIEVYFDREGKERPLDDVPVLAEYEKQTKLIDISGDDFEKIRFDIKSKYPNSRYLHVIEVSNISI